MRSNSRRKRRHCWTVCFPYCVTRACPSPLRCSFLSPVTPDRLGAFDSKSHSFSVQDPADEVLLWVITNADLIVLFKSRNVRYTVRAATGSPLRFAITWPGPESARLGHRFRDFCAI